MDRINHVTATVDKKFQSGNPTTGQKATVVTAVWLNGMQEELANFIESQGIVLDVDNNSQLLEALTNIKKSADLSLNILNNQAGTSMGPAFAFDLTKVKAVVIECDLYRTDSSVEKTANGRIVLTSKPKAGTCDIIQKFDFDDDHGVVFGFDITGDTCQLKYTSNNYVGANYQGKMVYKVTVFKK